MIDNQLLEEKSREVKEAFDMFDRDKDGKININELSNVMKALGYNLTEKEVSEIMGENDNDNDGKLKLEEVLFLVNNRSKEIDTEDELIEAFRLFDKEGKGYIGIDEIKHLLLMLGESMSNEEIEEIITQADLDGDGKVSYQDFAKLMLLK
jgi:calmodulin